VAKSLGRRRRRRAFARHGWRSILNGQHLAYVRAQTFSAGELRGGGGISYRRVPRGLFGAAAGGQGGRHLLAAALQAGGDAGVADGGKKAAERRAAGVGVTGSSALASRRIEQRGIDSSLRRFGGMVGGMVC